MRSFYIDQGQAANVCNTCCCQAISAKRPERDIVQLFYAAWVLPQGNGSHLTSRTEFMLEQTTQAAPAVVSGQPALVVADSQQLVNLNTPITLDLNTLIQNAIAPFDISLVAMSGPEHGVASLAAGVLTYTPNTGFLGTDRVYYMVKEEDTGRYLVGEITFRVGNPATVVVPYEGAVYVDRTGLKVDDRFAVVSFPLVVTPKARQGEVYRLTVRQYAVDCDGRETFRDDCFDIGIGKC